MPISPDTGKHVIALRGVSKSFKLGETSVHALRGLDLDIEAGEFVAIVGTSGSGKTTLLNIIGGIDIADSGVVTINGQNFANLSEREKSRFRNRFFGFVFQSFNLMPMLTVAENVELPLMIQKDISAAERRLRVDQLLKDVGLEAYAKQKPDKLSGGQRQRVAIARALVSKPLVVIADEPTANLDSETTQQIVGLMQELNRKNQVTFLFSTHDEKLMGRVRRIIRMRDGQIVSQEKDL